MRDTTCGKTVIHCKHDSAKPHEVQVKKHTNLPNGEPFNRFQSEGIELTKVSLDILNVVRRYGGALIAASLVNFMTSTIRAYVHTSFVGFARAAEALYACRNP